MLAPDPCKNYLAGAMIAENTAIVQTPVSAPQEAETETKHRVFVVDDHPIFRHGIVQLINCEGDFTVCGQASSSTEALSGLRGTEADVVVIDVSLQGCTGIELIKHLTAEHPKLPILVLSMHDERHFAVRALRAGADGYVMKRERTEEFIYALRQVLAGKLYVSHALGERLILQAVRG
jgi:DNA-binding NarL/FixJ family response regulator